MGRDVPDQSYEPCDEDSDEYFDNEGFENLDPKLLQEFDYLPVDDDCGLEEFGEDEEDEEDKIADNVEKGNMEFGVGSSAGNKGKDEGKSKERGGPKVYSPPNNGGLLTQRADPGVLILSTVLILRADEANSHSNRGWRVMRLFIQLDTELTVSPETFRRSDTRPKQLRLMTNYRVKTSDDEGFTMLQHGDNIELYTDDPKLRPLPSYAIREVTYALTADLCRVIITRPTKGEKKEDKQSQDDPRKAKRGSPAIYC
ncbi:hypothetical protein B0H66DRAFT_598671 [Apodospora peruviana]|uniref:Uncharacterized protein n=1 Tax=Apodospora peruviana TaxID=516989 RepID=A0AAE0ITX5_9PEZI|nr:hypothetical protein B0H66DRAFT_598671 [Apodospora peruviana]